MIESPRKCPFSFGHHLSWGEMLHWRYIIWSLKVQGFHAPMMSTLNFPENLYSAPKLIVPTASCRRLVFRLNSPAFPPLPKALIGAAIAIAAPHMDMPKRPNFLKMEVDILCYCLIFCDLNRGGGGIWRCRFYEWHSGFHREVREISRFIENVELINKNSDKNPNRLQT